jgi:hypothetical protein
MLRFSHHNSIILFHTAGGRMIGKKMASLLLEKKTLEFYKVRNNNDNLCLALPFVYVIILYMSLLTPLASSIIVGWGPQ